MKIKDRLIGALFGEVIEGEIKKRIKAASVADLEKEDIGWRRLTGNANRSLSPLKQERMIEIAFWLWENNPLARWLIETTKDFILAEGLPYEAKNEDIKKLLDVFWTDPINRMDLYLEKYVRELFLYGEICLTVFTSEQTGKVRLGYIDPADIKDVVTDPENVRMVIGIVLKDRMGQAGRKLKTILPFGAEEIISKSALALRDTYLDGECFFFAINNVTNSPRGRSDILVTADWLDAYEQFLFDYADKWPLLNTFVWDLMVQGGDESAIKEQIKSFTKKSGSIYGHNEKVTLAPSTPDLKAVDADAGARLFRNHILGAHSFPEHWFGGGGDVNRATAAEMASPTMKTLSSKQRYVKYILEAILGIVILKSRTARYLNISDAEAKAYSIIVPEIEVKDLAQYGPVIQQTTSSLAQAEMQGWIDKETARKIFVLMMGYLGIELDTEEIGQAMDKQGEKKGYEDYIKKGDNNA